MRGGGGASIILGLIQVYYCGGAFLKIDQWVENKWLYYQTANTTVSIQAARRKEETAVSTARLPY